MKRLSFLLFFFICGTFANAQSQTTKPKVTLTFFSEKGERFWVVINGVRQNTQAQQNVKIADQTGNAWKAQIVFENQNLPEIGKSIYIPTEPTQDAELVYQVKKNRKGIYQVRLFSSTGFPNQMVEIIRDGSGFKMPRLPINLPVPIERPRDNPNNYPTHYPPTDNPANNPTPNDRQRTCNVMMDEMTFDRLKESVAHQSFEETKQNTAKQAIGYYCVSTAQVRSLLRLFSFEQTRLEFAKWAHDYTYDKENYYQLNDAFDFSMSVDELQEYIKNKR